jgi:hypothetical protein
MKVKKIIQKGEKEMTNEDYKKLFIQPVKDLMYANVLQARWERSRIQARNRSKRSDCVEYTPFEEVRDQDHDEVRQIDSSSI